MQARREDVKLRGVIRNTGLWLLKQSTKQARCKYSKLSDEEESKLAGKNVSWLAG